MKRPDERRSALARCFVVRTNANGMPRACLASLIWWLLFNAFPAGFPLNGETVEYPVKLAFLYNFAKFVEWPAGSYTSPGASLAICVVGHDPFDADIEEGLRTRNARGHPIRVQRLGLADRLTLCQMVFIPVTEKDRAGEIVRSLKGSNVLTVGETEGFAAMGGVINLTIERSGVHFEINRLAADRAHLKISSQLLSLARIVTERVPRQRN
jgi:hypothetical protein